MMLAKVSGSTNYLPKKCYSNGNISFEGRKSKLDKRLEKLSQIIDEANIAVYGDEDTKLLMSIVGGPDAFIDECRVVAKVAKGVVREGVREIANEVKEGISSDIKKAIKKAKR